MVISGAFDSPAASRNRLEGKFDRPICLVKPFSCALFRAPMVSASDGVGLGQCSSSRSGVRPRLIADSSACRSRASRWKCSTQILVVTKMSSRVTIPSATASAMPSPTAFSFL
ncbi:hypothetical protein D3C72_2071810 [compost metagenome]